MTDTTEKQVDPWDPFREARGRQADRAAEYHRALFPQQSDQPATTDEETQ